MTTARKDVTPPKPPSERPFRLELAYLPTARDARGEAVTLMAARDLGIKLESTETRDIFLLDCDLGPDELELLAAAFEDPVVQSAHIGSAPAAEFNWSIQVGYKPGVTDNVGTSAKVVISDLLGRKLEEDESAYSATLYLLRGDLQASQANQVATDLLANPLIQSIDVRSFEEWASSPPDTTVPKITSRYEPGIETSDLDRSDDELTELSHRSLWALSLPEMHTIRDHFASDSQAAVRSEIGLTSKPTDVEMECLAQTWSEHCKHKIFNSSLDYEDSENGERRTINSLFDTFIRGATSTVGADKDWLLSVFKDNAGVVRFTEDTNLVFKVETHNTPSALDPYGGAITGIVGVNRDPLGTGRGADLLINVWGYCFASPFYSGKVPEGLMHPRRIRDGVHKGVIDGGNQSGIPYGRGWEIFDERYLGKPLVYCGTVGIMPATLHDGAPAHEKILHPGDLIVMVGGRIGADGIHGATFSSQELHEESPSQAVQIGDPITQKKMTDFLLEALDLGLFTSLTDNGAGGLSSSVGEMAQTTGGADLNLAKAALKYPGLMPWEILLSEAQERMTVGVPAEQLDHFLELADRREVEAAALGTFTDSGYFCVRYGEEVVAYLEMEFLHDGWPKPVLPARWERPESRFLPEINATVQEVLEEILRCENIASKEVKSRQYDHEVKGRTIIKPFTGISSDVPSDATVFLVDYERTEGVVLSEGINPYYSDLDTRAMAMAVVDEAVRRLICAGARPDTISALDNFCWPDPVESTSNPDGRYKLAQLIRTCEGLYDACVAYGVPLISGKDSMKNDSTRGGVKISIPPTLLVSAMGRIDDVRTSVTPEPKGAGDLIYAIGKTRQELGASELARWAEAGGRDAAVGGSPPETYLEENIACYNRLAAAIADQIPESVKTPSMGGLGVALAWMAFGSELGIEIDLDLIPTSGEVDLWGQLFSESTGRFLVTVKVENAGSFEEAMEDTPLARIGTVNNSGRLTVTSGGATVIDADVMELKRAWQSTLAGF